jgi:hypothetical protein
MCPALILASNRKHKVIGRTTILTTSTRHKKGIKYQGELLGSSLAKDEPFTRVNRILVIHKHKAIERLNLKVVVNGYL